MNSKNKTTQGYKNKLNYINEYNKKNYRVYTFKLNNKKDKELIDFLDNSPSRSDAIRIMYEAYKKHSD